MWLLNVGSFHLGLQIRTHSIRKAHENIDKTLKAAEVILSHFDQYRQVGFVQSFFTGFYADSMLDDSTPMICFSQSNFLFIYIKLVRVDKLKVQN